MYLIISERFRLKSVHFFEKTLGTQKDKKGHTEKVSKRRKIIVSTWDIVDSEHYIGKKYRDHYYFLIHLQMSLVSTKKRHLVEYTPRKDIKSVAQSAKNAKRQTDDDPTPFVVAEIPKFLAKSSSGYGSQVMDRSQQTLPKYFGNAKIYAAMNSKLFKNSDNQTMHCLKLKKALRVMKFYYNFFDQFSEVNKVTAVEMESNQLYFAFAEI